MDKKISLEHTIKNVVSEAIGVSGTDKFKGTPKAFLQPIPHIEPKVGDTHPDTATETAKRNTSKIKNSETMKEEEEPIEEGAAPRPPKGYVAPKIRPKVGIGPGNKVAPEKSTWEKLTDISDDGTVKGLAKDLIPVVDTVRQAKRTGAAYNNAASEFKKGNYWNAAKGAGDTALQGGLTGLSAVGDAATLTGIGASVVEPVRGAIAATKIAKAASTAADVEKFIATSKTVPVKKTPALAAPEAPKAPKAPKPEAPKTHYEPSTGKKYDSPGKAKAAAAETQFAKDIRAAAGKVDAVKAADKTKLAGPVPDLQVPVSKGELVPVSKPAPKTVAPKATAPSEPIVPEVSKPADVKPAAEKKAPSPYLAKHAEKLKASSAASKLSDLPKYVTEPPAKSDFKLAQPAPENLPAVQTSGAEPVRQKAATPAATPSLPFKDKPAPIEFKVAEVEPAKPATDTATDTATKVDTKTATATKTATKTATATQTATKPAPAVAPKTATVTPTQPAAPTPTPPVPPKGPESPKKKRPVPFKIPSINIPNTPTSTQQGYVPTTPYVHRSSFSSTLESVQEANGEERTEIENVARLGSKSKLAKQAQIKTKIIDEEIKKKIDIIKQAIADKKTSTIITNPKLKNPDPA